MGRIFVFFILLAVQGPLSAETLIMDLRSNPEAAKAYCEKHNDCRVLETKTKEFPNGNTFVQFSGSTSNKDLRLLLPAQLSSDALMEALIKVRTASVQNAQEIGVEIDADDRLDIEDSLSRLHFTPHLLTDYFRTAGAHWIKIGKHKIPLGSAHRYVSTYKKKDYRPVVMDLGHESVSAAIAKELKLPLFSAKQLEEKQDAVNINKEDGLQIFMVAPVDQPVNENFFKTLAQVYKQKLRGHKVVLITPYFPYARSDKMDQKGVSITGRLIADLMEAVGTDVASFSRLHAPQAQGFFRIPTVHTSGRETINQFLKEYAVDAIVSPDAGFQKDATLYADDLKLPVYVLNKQRNPVTGESELKEMGELKLEGLRLAIIDDETASGSTLGDAAQFLKSKGAKNVIGVVTHLAGNAGKALENTALDLVVVANTFPIRVPQSDRFKALSIGEEIARNLQDVVIGHGCSQFLTENEQR